VPLPLDTEIRHDARVTPEDQRTIGECLRAAVEGPFFPEWEFSLLMGLSRDEVAAVSAEWPDTSDAETQGIAVNNVLNNLLGYPHRTSEDTWHSFIKATPREVGAVLARWRGEGDELDASGEGYAKRLM
jgi:hypothetical protein